MTKTREPSAKRLIFLCWLVYTCSYIGKLSYSANINQIEQAFGVSHSQTGAVSTFFFFVYGAGQIVNGLLCKKYNLKYVIFTALMVASTANLLMVLLPSFAPMKYIWLVNGAAMSFLWTGLIRLLSETIGKADYARAIVVMGTTVATGTFLVYGLSAIFAAIGAFRVTFYVATAILLTVALVWLYAFSRLVPPLRDARKEAQAQETPQTDAEDPVAATAARSHRIPPSFYTLSAVLAFFAVANNLVKDGLTTWTPSMLSALYDTPGWLSILLALLLPMLAIGGTVVAVWLQQRTRDFVGTCTLLFLSSAALIGVVILFLATSFLVVTICAFALVSCLMAGVNNVITSMFPLQVPAHMNAGKTAGLLNGFCYLGSTVSSYGLGAIADAWGWSAVFVVLLSVACFVTLLGSGYLLQNHIRRRGQK